VGDGFGESQSRLADGAHDPHDADLHPGAGFLRPSHRGVLRERLPIPGPGRRRRLPSGQSRVLRRRWDAASARTGMSSPERYLRPEVMRQVARLDLRAKFIVEGFLAGLHASPFHGFSVEFSEHRKYVPGDDLKDLDWNVYAKTDKYYLKKFQAETNVTGYLVM